MATGSMTVGGMARFSPVILRARSHAVQVMKGGASGMASEANPKVRASICQF